MAKTKKELEARIQELERICGEAYQVIGILASDCGRFEGGDVIKILDNASKAKMIHKDVLPFESKGTYSLETYAEFYTPGTIVSNAHAIRVENRSILSDTSLWPESAFACQCYSKEKFITKSGQMFHSVRYDTSPRFYRGVLINIDALPNTEENQILIDNIRTNNYTRVVKTIHGRYLPIGDRDVVIL